MVTLKFKYTLEEANEKLKELAPKLSVQDKLAYSLATGVGGTTLWNYLNGRTPSIVAADHLIGYIENCLKKKAA